MAVPPADRVRQGLVAASIVATIAANGLANAIPFFGRTTADVSAAYPTAFTPAGYVFGIWGVIYLALVAHAVWQARAARARDPRLRRAAPWIVASGAANVGWLLAWHADLPVLAALLLAALLGVLIRIDEAFRAGPTDPDPRRARAFAAFARTPFRIYLGWVSVATAANLAVAGVALGWDGAPFAPETWAMLVVGVATAIALARLATRGDVPFALVAIWAFVGIAIRAGIPGPLAFAAFVAVALVMGATVGRLVRPAPAGGRT
ncbi:MAG: hypothetical protein RI554_04735 [Trueperaceae bacterium]|nr:hypothetical protein [Trueperaceae bacterium]